MDWTAIKEIIAALALLIGGGSGIWAIIERVRTAKITAQVTELQARLGAQTSEGQQENDARTQLDSQLLVVTKELSVQFKETLARWKESEAEKFKYIREHEECVRHYEECVEQHKATSIITTQLKAQNEDQAKQIAYLHGTVEAFKAAGCVPTTKHTEHSEHTEHVVLEFEAKQPKPEE